MARPFPPYNVIISLVNICGYRNTIQICTHILVNKSIDIYGDI